jgi:hypothetical protein
MQDGEFLDRQFLLYWRYFLNLREAYRRAPSSDAQREDFVAAKRGQTSLAGFTDMSTSAVRIRSANVAEICPELTLGRAEAEPR